MWPRKWLQTTDVRAVRVLGMVLPSSKIGKVGWSAALMKCHRVVAVRVLGSQQKKSSVLPAGWSRLQGPEARPCFLALAPSWP